jgi:hypothetical protein
MLWMGRRASGDYLKQKYGFGSKRTLDKLAVVGGGPEYHKPGSRAIYSDEALDAYALRKLGEPQQSTAENSRPISPPGEGKRPRGRPCKHASIDAMVAGEAAE